MFTLITLSCSLASSSQLILFSDVIDLGKYFALLNIKSFKNYSEDGANEFRVDGGLEGVNGGESA